VDITKENIISHRPKFSNSPGSMRLSKSSEIDRILERIRLRATRRIAWLRYMWISNHHPGEGTDQTSYHTEVDGYLYHTDKPVSEYNWYKKEETMRPLNRKITKIEKAQIQDENSRLNKLVHLFGLLEEESDILQTCLALSIQSNLGRVYAYLQDHNGRGYTTGELVARLFDHGLYLPLSAESPLKIWDIIRETEMSPTDPPRLEIDPSVRNWILGKNELPETLVGKAFSQHAHAPLSNWPLVETLAFINKIRDADKSIPIRIFIAGAEGSGRSSFAACLCGRLGMTVLSIDSDRIPENKWTQTFVHAHRHAHLNLRALVWKGSAILERIWPQNIFPFSIQFIIGEVDEFIMPITGMVDYRIEPGAIDFEERLRLWLQYVPSASTWPAKELSEMNRKYSATIGQIIAARDKAVASVEEASESLRASSRRRLGDLAQLMSSQFGWDDLVLPNWLLKSLEDFLFEAKERSVLWEQTGAKRLFPQGKGLFALFTGHPGTGKTMAAQVIANSLKLDLFRIDLSTIVSKYVGETSKNIERIFTRAQRMDIVLFFDEADALFGKRTELKDAHDRYANTDTNYLLQAIEQYPGVAILASNKKSNIDSGFTRRLRYVMDFQKPDFAQRLRLWRQISQELSGPETTITLDKDFQILSEIVELTGAQIKFTLLSAMFMAHQDQTAMTQNHILRGLEKEMMKEGRPVPRQIKEIFK
jgi:adenylate kinase family enzyme